MTNEQILLDALEYYTVDPVNRRCTDGGACYYSAKTINKETTSEGCLIGRLLSPELAESIDAKYTKSIDVIFSNGDFELPDFINAGNAEFLAACQTLHDISSNWSDAGLSNIGKTEVRKIIYNYKLDASKFAKFL